MIFNARDKITRGLLSLVRTPLPLKLYYRHHFPLPSVILIENTNCCNAPCVMCPREKLTRKPGFMAFELLEKIIRDVSGSRRKPVVHLHGFGEPLLDEVLPERIKLAKAFGIKHTYLVTNGAATKEFKSLWCSVLDKRMGDCLNFSSPDNFGGGR